jgi:hypothetical protein
LSKPAPFIQADVENLCTKNRPSLTRLKTDFISSSVAFISSSTFICPSHNMRFQLTIFVILSLIFVGLGLKDSLPKALRTNSKNLYSTSLLMTKNISIVAEKKSGNILETYNTLLQEKPYVTKILSSAIVGGLGDVLIQLLGCFQRKQPFQVDLRRLAVFSTVAGIYIAPVIHVWFDLLEKMKLNRFVGDGKFAKALAMIFLDQTVATLLVTVGFFYAFELVIVFLTFFTIYFKTWHILNRFNGFFHLLNQSD